MPPSTSLWGRDEPPGVRRWDEFEPADRTHPAPVLPDAAQLFWGAIPVPGDKSKLLPDLTFAHRLIYRTHLTVPVGNQRVTYFLHLPANNLITSVFVNGRFCGGAATMLVPWDCDVTAAAGAYAARPGHDYGQR